MRVSLGCLPAERASECILAQAVVTMKARGAGERAVRFLQPGSPSASLPQNRVRVLLHPPVPQALLAAPAI